MVSLIEPEPTKAQIGLAKKDGIFETLFKYLIGTKKIFDQNFDFSLNF